MTRKNSGTKIVTDFIAEAKKRRVQMLALYDRGKTLEEVGFTFGCTRQRAGQLMKLARIEAGRPAVVDPRRLTDANEPG